MKNYLYKCETCAGIFYSNSVSDIKRKASMMLNPFYNAFDTVKIVDNKTGKYICSLIRKNNKTPNNNWNAGKWI